MAFSKSLPGEAEWASEPLCLDGESAHRNFFGKDLDAAFALFVDNAMHYQEDLMFMPAVCFRYYVRAYSAYLLSQQSESDSDGASCYLGLIDFRHDELAEASDEVRNEIVRVLDRLATEQAWYDADDGIYGSFPKKAQRCREKLARD
ncbi:MAG: hypothetical protein AAF488_09630 [Planctomycetota bacterium]